MRWRNYDSLYVLTGYRHSRETFQSMGCRYDDALRCTPHDYDGELIGNPGIQGSERLHKGYFGFGAVLDSLYDRNSVVIPGMLFRLPDLMFGVIMRAGEYAYNNNLVK